MANVPSSQSGGTAGLWTLDTTATISLGDVGSETGGAWVLQFVPTGSGGSIVFKQRVTGSGLTGANLQSPIIYESDGETAIAAGTSVSAAGIYYVYSDGLDTFMDYTQSTGSLKVYYRLVKI